MARPSILSAISLAAATAPVPAQEHAMSIRFSATISAKVLPAGSLGFNFPSRERNATDSRRAFGRPPGFELGAPFLNQVPFPISGSNFVVITTIGRSRVEKVKRIKGDGGV